MKKLFSLMLVLALLLVGGNTSASADTRSDYESYVSAYNAYRNAVNENKPASEVQGLLSAYKAAKTVYESQLNRASDNTSAAETTSTTTDTVSEAATFVATGEGQRSAAVAQKQLPVGLQRILEQLWSEKGRKAPDQAMKLLASFIESSSGSKYADVARSERAKAYE